MSIRVILYTKPGCHLCEDALRLLREMQSHANLTIEEIDITTDRELFKKYFDKIPVLLIDHRTTLAAPIRMEDVRAALSSFSSLSSLQKGTQGTEGNS